MSATRDKDVYQTVPNKKSTTYVSASDIDLESSKLRVVNLNVHNRIIHTTLELEFSKAMNVPVSVFFKLYNQL